MNEKRDKYVFFWGVWVPDDSYLSQNLPLKGFYMPLHLATPWCCLAHWMTSVTASPLVVAILKSQHLVENILCTPHVDCTESHTRGREVMLSKLSAS